jgi:high-affinity nickel-transport protein
LGNLDLNSVGYVIVALFAATWAVALVWWKVGRVEDRWNAGLAKAAAEPTSVSS